MANGFDALVEVIYENVLLPLAGEYLDGSAIRDRYEFRLQRALTALRVKFPNPNPMIEDLIKDYKEKGDYSTKEKIMPDLRMAVYRAYSYGRQSGASSSAIKYLVNEEVLDVATDMENDFIVWYVELPSDDQMCKGMFNGDSVRYYG